MQKCQLFTIKITLMLALFTACTLFLDTSPIIEKDASFKTDFENKNWKPVKRSGADYAFQKGTAYLFATSVCPAPQDSLEKMALTLLVSEKNILNKETFTQKKISYLKTEGKFQVDQTNFHIYLTNYKEDECYYEYVLLNQGEIDPETKKDYESFLDSFEH